MMHGFVVFDGGKKLTHFEINGSNVSVTLTGKIVGPHMRDDNVYTADIATTAGSPDTADIVVHTDSDTLVHESCFVGGRGHADIHQ